MTRFVWIPEAPRHPGLYANKNGADLDTGKVQGFTKPTSTMSPHHALQFETREECQAWCDANPHPVFEPREHGFSE
ncbi:hypothetical protein [Geothrix campi]|uniref:hypothetical protein n=1 Tax=Geothrix campi TaxID=2966450 RepID=UPI002148B697|nr:hypothetical protein [Geothrix sp. SG10]